MPFNFEGYTDLEDEDLAGGAVDIEFAVGGIIGIDALPGQEVDDVLRSVLIPVSGGDLRGPNCELTIS